MRTIKFEPSYCYSCIVRRVIDGDTIDVDMNLGLGVIKASERLRLSRINAPELRGLTKSAGILSKEWLTDHVLDREVIVETIKDKKGKYGRYIAEVWLPGDDGTPININDALVKKGMASYRTY